MMVRLSSDVAAAGKGDALPGTRGSRIALAGLVFSALFLLAWVLLRGLFPRSYGGLSFVTAVALLFVYEAVPWVTLLFPAWVAGSSVLILVRRHAAYEAAGV
ncbi:MAG: hypothetical protein ACXWEZ_08920 [Actinomycetota bacterium]